MLKQLQQICAELGIRFILFKKCDMPSALILDEDYKKLYVSEAATDDKIQVMLEYLDCARRKVGDVA